MARLFTLLLILANIVLAVSGQLSIKTGMNQVGYITTKNVVPLVMAAFKNPFVIAGLISYTLAAVTWIIVLSRIDVGIAYPMLSLGYVLVLVFSVFWLGEHMTVMRMIGTTSVIFGVVLIFRS